MKFRRAVVAALGVGLFACCLGPAQGQVTVGIEFLQERFLAHEDVHARVTIRNFTGETIHFPANQPWLQFFVEATGERVVRRNNEVSISTPLSLGASEEAKVTVNIEPHFDFAFPDRYRVQASVYVPNLSAQVMSDKQSFHVVNGVKLWSQNFGVPRDPSQVVPGTPPEIRKYALLQYTRVDKVVLYFRLSNPNESEVYAVYPFGTLVSFARPEAIVDAKGHLHVLNQYTARGFGYTDFNWKGERVLHHTYIFDGSSRPRLALDKDGVGMVLGGRREFSERDFPPRKPMATADSPTPVAARADN